MPGMKSGLSDTNPTIVAAFKAALLHQGLLIAGVLALLALAWLAARQLMPAGRARAPQLAPVAGRGTLSVWQLGAGRWTLLQTVRVGIPYGSSG